MVSADNFFDLDPVLGRNGAPEKFHGDSSDITTDEALKFIRRQAGAAKPFLAVVWFGSPHVPHQALPADKAAYHALPEREQKRSRSGTTRANNPATPPCWNFARVTASTSTILKRRCPGFSSARSRSSSPLPA